MAVMLNRVSEKQGDPRIVWLLLFFQNNLHMYNCKLIHNYRISIKNIKFIYVHQTVMWKSV